MHYINKCKHGKVVSQCRCPGGTVTIVPCVNCLDNEIPSVDLAPIPGKVLLLSNGIVTTARFEMTIGGVTRMIDFRVNEGDFTSGIQGHHVGNGASVSDVV